MKKLIQIVPLIVIGLFTSVGYSGQEGHGGEAIVCPNQPTILYDVYEGRVLRNLNFDLGAASLSAMQKIELVLTRLSKLDSYRAEHYRKLAHSFMSEAQFGDFGLVPIEDSKHTILPEGCEIRQLVDQRVPQFSEDKRYLISQKLWDSMDEDQHAAVILHEIIYREAIALGQTDSVGTRYINEYLLSDKFNTITDTEYFRILRQAGFLFKEGAYITWKGVTYKVESEDTFSVTPHGYVAEGFLLEPTEVVVQGQKVTVNSGNLSFYDSGQLGAFFPPTEGISLKVAEQMVEFNWNPIVLSEAGSVKQGSLKGINYFKVQGQQLKFGATLRADDFMKVYMNRVWFYPNGQIENGVVYGVYNLKTPEGKTITIGKGKPILSAYIHKNGRTEYIYGEPGANQVEFDENGLIVSASPVSP